ncbi:hypothetical protein COLO4_15530 [Corchorus olitorius]|uniref:Uncharacterized protein n=1 Tax=Corchorus olitorius TaxID=93759 RepID=A0A1R3JMM0_9ROSI|nr:hypothetical protein COLO4_15530 [Corchorus olitorius]
MAKDVPNSHDFSHGFKENRSKNRGKYRIHV